MSAASTTTQLRLPRADRCVNCHRALAAGERASWNSIARTATCLDCTSVAPPPAPPAVPPVVAGTPGASAEREYQRRHDAREEHARATLGLLGVALARVIDEPHSTTAWQKGAEGERLTAKRLAKHLDGHPVRLLHDRRIRGRGPANIDHLAVGPGGVTVIDSKNCQGPVQVDRVGGLFVDRHDILLIGGRDRTKLIDGVEQQLRAVARVLERAGIETDLRGALCFPHPEGLPLLRQLAVREIVIDAPKPIAKLARRPGPLDGERIDHIWRALASALPSA